MKRSRRNSQLPPLSSVRAELARKSLAHFTRQAWHVIEPDRALAWNWHVDAVCRHLELVVPPDKRRLAQGDDTLDLLLQWLVVNIPPGHMKSILMNVMLPSWVWTFWPEWRGIFASYALSLSWRDALRTRDVVISDWYQSTFRPDWILREDQNAKGLFANTRGGLRQCISVGSGTTGFRGDFVGVDDPLNAVDAKSETMRLAANEWLDTASSSRLNDPRVGARAIIMQRLHEADPSGHVLSKEGSRWVHLCLPSEFDPERACVTPIFRDPRTEPGELLFPEYYNREVLNQARIDLGAEAYAGQHLQNPQPAGGLILKKHWWRFWQWPGMDLPPVVVQNEAGEYVHCPVETIPASFDQELQSWDFTFKKREDNDFVAGGVWGRKGARAYMLDLVNKRLSFTESVAAVRRMSAKWPNAVEKLVEDKANGPAIIDTLHEELPGMVPVEPDGGKEARAYAVSPVIESGNVYLPHPQIHAWADDVLAQTSGFPKAAHDDIVDQLTQALLRLLVRRLGSGGSGSTTTTDQEIQEYTPR